MSKNIRTQMNKVVGKSLNAYYQRVKPAIDDIKFKEQYQGRIIDCMVGEVDDNYIETPETDAPIVKLEYSKEGLVKIPTIKGKTILVDADGNETDAPGEGCRLVSVGEDRDKIIILSKNKNLFPYTNISINAKENQTWYSLEGKQGMYGSNMWSKTNTWIYVPRGYIKVTTQELFNCGIQMVTPNEEIISYNGNSLFEGGYVTFRLRNNDTVNKFGYKNLMFEWSQSPILNNSSYIEPKQHKTEISLKEPLRSLPNGVCDEIVGNKLIRRIGKVTLTGEEGWWSNWTNVSFFEWFSNLRITNWKPISDNIAWYSNKLKSTTSYSIEQQGQFNCFCFGVDWNATNPKVIVRPSYDIVEEGNVDQFKEWLKKNNMIILYELAEPIIEELPNSITLQGFDDTTMYIENSITPTVTYGYNALIPYKEELRTQKEEVETNTLDIENNIIPYLMDMEYNLMLMEDN